MTTPTPPHARTSALVRGWRAFRRWRRSRPFWGGLFTLLAGLEIFATTQGSLGGLSFQMGPTGFLSWLIPTILMACGLLLWFSPAQRMFYAVVAAATAVFSLIGVNLGGFLIGLLLGMVGSALGFAWAPVAPPPPEPEPAAEVDGAAEPDNETTVDNLLFAVTLILLSVSAVGLVTLRGGAPAYAAPCPTTPAPSASPTTEPEPPPAPSPTAAPDGSGEETDDGGNLITDILEGIGDLFGIGEPDGEEEAPAAAATPTPTASGATPGGTATPTPTPTTPAGCQPGTGTGDDEDPPAATVVDPPADIEPIGRIPSIMTGTKLAMWRLTYVGVTAMKLKGGGTMDVLQFAMAKSTTDDFELQPAIPGGKRMSLKSSALTVEGNVRFFTPRFEGKLLGIPQVYTPESPPPLPPGPEVPLIPVVYTDINIQLAYVDSNILDAPDFVNTV